MIFGKKFQIFLVIFVSIFVMFGVLAVVEVSKTSESTFYVEENGSVNISIPIELEGANKYSLSVEGNCQSNFFENVIYLDEINSNLSINLDAFFDDYNTTHLFSVFIEDKTNEPSNSSVNVSMDNSGDLLVESEVVQASAEVGKPVSWTHKIKIQNNNSEKKEVLINSSVPAEVSETLIIDEDSRIVEGEEVVKSVPVDNMNLNLEEGVDTVKEISFKEDLDSFELKEYEVKYETPAPEKIESDIVETEDKISKDVLVRSNASVHYENVLSWSDIPESKKEQVQLYWVVDGKKVNIVNEARFNVTLYDTNDNGLVDKVSWIVPHLSEQKFVIEIVLAVQALHLNSNREVIEDISDAVLNYDGVWSKSILEGEYVRVSFERNLTSSNDITIFPRVVFGNPTIEVYAKDSDEVIATFNDVNPLIEFRDFERKIYLTNLLGTEDTFDLRVVGGSVEFDYITDPSAIYDATKTTPYCDGTTPCIANSSLLQCRDSINDGNGPEPNQPNTVDTCADGTGTYATPSCGGDESVENITIYDYNNSVFRPNDFVGVQAWVHCYDTNDHLALVYTNNSNTATPSWMQIQYIANCPAAGYQLISFDNFTLNNTAGNHSVRVWINYDTAQDTTQTCGARSTGTNYADNDDVVFTVTANSAPTTPTNITCDGGVCNATFVNSITLNCSGSTDSDNDLITYAVEASLLNITTSADQESTVRSHKAGNISHSQIYDFTTCTTGTNCWAYENDVDVFPFANNANNNNSHVLASAAQYTSLSLPDTDRWTTSDPGFNDEILLWNEFNINLTQSPRASITGINLSFYGYTNAATTPYSLWALISGQAWQNDASWTQVGTTTNVATGTDSWVNGTLSSNMPNYIDATTGRISWITHSDTSSESMNANYVQMKVNYFTTNDNNYNETFVEYPSIGGNAFSNVSNITIKTEVSYYNPTGSSTAGNSVPDLEVGVWNGTDYKKAYFYNISTVMGSSAANSTTTNFSLVIYDSTILSAWQNESNRKFEIRGVFLDTETGNTDVINWSSVWVTLNGREWQNVGNHTNGSSYSWNVSALGGRTDINLRCRAIDLNGTNIFSSYFDKNANVTIYADTVAPVVNLNAPTNQSVIANSTINFNFTATDNYASTMSCSLYLNNTLNQTNSSSLNNSLTNFQVTGLIHGLYYWNVSCTDSSGNTNWSSIYQVFVNMSPYISSVTPIPNPIAGGNVIAISPEGFYDPNNDSLYYYCVNDSSLAITSANTLCSQANTLYSYPYTNMNCTYAVPSVTHSQNVYCRVYDGTYYSSNVTSSFDSDATPPTTTVNNVAGDLTAPYYDTTNDGQTNITIDGESGMVCRWYTSDQAYNAGTGNPCETSGTQAICITVPSEGLPDYYVSCADSLGNGQNASQNLDITSITVDWTAPTTSDDSTSVIHVPTYVINITESDNIDGDPVTQYCTDTTGSCNPTTSIDNGGSITFTSANRGQNYLRYNSSDYVGNVQSTTNVSVQINRLPIFGLASANESGVLKGGNAIKITTWSNDSDLSQNLTLFVCNTGNVNSSGCVNTTYCTNNTDQENASCVFASETDNSLHTWYAFIYDSLNENATANFSGTYTTDSNAPFITIVAPQNITYNESTMSISVSLNENGNWVAYRLDGGSNISMVNITSQVWNTLLLSLTNGLHNITFWANDSYGNYNLSQYVYFTVNVSVADTTPPAITINSPVNGTYYSNVDFVINITTDEDLSWAGYNYNGTLYNLSNESLTNWVIETNEFANESYYNLTVYANDTSNNQNSKSVQFYTDSLAPRYTEAQAVPSPTNVSVAVNCSIVWNDTFNIQNVKIAENSSGSYENHSISFSGTNGLAYYEVSGTKLSNKGAYGCIFYAEDLAGNMNTTSVVFAVNDVTNPVITVISPTNSTYNQDYINASVLISENASLAWYSLNGAANVSMSNSSKTSWAYNLSGFSDGGYNITFYANDTSGNLGVSDTVYFTINTAAGDTVAPVLTIDSPTNNTYYSATEVFLNVSSNENLALAWYSLNGSANATLGNYSSVDWNITLSGLGTENTNTVIVYANDTSGNLGLTQVVFYTDIVAPRMDDAQSNPASANQTQTVNCSVYINDSFSLLSVKIAENSTGSFVNHTIDLTSEGWANYSIINMNSGAYQCIFYAKDSAGNANMTNVTFLVSDVTAPTLTINSPLNDTYSTSSILLSVTLSENATGDVNYSLDGAANTSLRGEGLSWSKTLSVADGLHTVFFYAEDSFGNLGINNISFTVDTSINDVVPPTLVIWSPSNNTYYTSANVLLNLTTTENASWAGYSNNSGAVQDLDNVSKTNWNATIGFAEGQHNITFYANDTSTNKNQGTNFVSMYVDLTNPSVDSFACDSPVNDSLNVTCNISVSDAVGLNYAFIRQNSTGSFANSSNISLAGTSDWINYTLLSGNTTPSTFRVEVYLYDDAGRLNDSEFYDVTISDDTLPIISNITYIPNATDDLDPGTTLNVTAFIEDDYILGDVYLMYKNLSDASWSFVQMTNTSIELYNATFTSGGGYWSFEVNVTDAAGNRNISAPINLSFFNDTSQNVSTTVPNIKSVTYAQRSGNNSMGSLLLNNTGDNELTFNVSVYSASIGSRLSVNYSSSSSQNYTVSAGSFENITIDVNTTGLTVGLYSYSINVSSAAGVASYSKELNIQSAEGPYLEVSIDTYFASVTKGDTAVSFVASVTNLGTADADDTSLNWTLPSAFSLSSGSLSRIIGNLPIGSTATNTISVDVSSTTTESSVSIVATADSSNADSSSDTKTVTIGSPTTVTTTTTAGPSGGGGTSVSAIGGGGITQYNKEVEVIRGDKDTFDIEVYNRNPSALLIDVTLDLSGFRSLFNIDIDEDLSQYISVSPSEIRSIGPNSSRVFTITIKAPVYKSFEEHDLIALIKGTLVSETGKKTPYQERQFVRLTIQEVGAVETNKSLTEAEAAIEEMRAKGFYVVKVEQFLNQAKADFADRKNKEAYDLANEIIAVKTLADQVYDLIERVKEAINDPRKMNLLTQDIPTQIVTLGGEVISIDDLLRDSALTGNAVFESPDAEQVLNMAIAAFQRGDYQLAFERAQNSQVLLLLDRKGSFAVFLYLYWHFVLLGFAIFSIFGFVVYRGSQRLLVARRIQDIDKEEDNIGKLIIKLQNDYVQGKISEDEYSGNLASHKKKLARIQKDRLKLRNTRIKVLHPREIENDLDKEKDQVEQEMKTLQIKYFRENKIPKEDYGIKFNIFSERLAEIEGERVTLHLMQKGKEKKTKERLEKETEKEKKKITKKIKKGFFSRLFRKEVPKIHWRK